MATRYLGEVDYSSELRTARMREETEGCDLLCPIALDDGWKIKVLGDPEAGTPADLEWEHLREKVALDFSKWKTKAFDGPFDQLVKGLLVYYPPKDTPEP